MNYSFVRIIYEHCDYGNKRTQWNQSEAMNCAERVALQWNEIVEKEAFATLKKVDAKSFVKLTKYLEAFHLFRVDKNGVIKEREELSVNKKLNRTEYCSWTKEESLYLCWVLKEDGLYEKDCLTLYVKLLKVMGEEYNMLEFSNVEDVLLSLVLLTGYGFSEYCHLLNDWIREEKDEVGEGTLKLPYADDIKELTFAQWKKIVDAGMEVVDNVQATRVSMTTLENDFNALLYSGIYDGKKGVHEIFSEDFCKKVVNTNARRKFYFFRILLRIMEKQKEDILQALEEYCKGDSKVGTKKIEELVSNCWFEKVKSASKHSNIVYHCDIPWSKIAEGPRKVISLENESDDIVENKLDEEKKITLEQVREDFENSRIRPSSIARAFNEAFSLHGYAFEKSINDDNQEPARNVAPRIQKLLLDGKQKISREMLLLSVLLARANGIDRQMDLNYVKEHVLYNSRYLKKLDEQGNEIDGYFVYMMNEFDKLTSVDDRVRLLKKVSENLTWEISENVFHDILYNKGGSKV